MKDWPQTVTELTGDLRNLRGGAPEVMKAFSKIAMLLWPPKRLTGKLRSSSHLASQWQLDVTIALPFTRKQPLSKAPVARKLWMPWAWRFTWEPVPR